MSWPKYERESTEYKYVEKRTYRDGHVVYSIRYNNQTKDKRKKVSFSKTYSDLRTASIAIDKILIGLGKQPVNILKPKPEMTYEIHTKSTYRECHVCLFRHPLPDLKEINDKFICKECSHAASH